MLPKKNSDKQLAEIPELDIAVLRLKLCGVSPLICHNWSKKAQEEMLSKQVGAVKSGKKAPKNPVQDFVDSLYILPGVEPILNDTSSGFDYQATMEGRFGFPAVGFKAAAVTAAKDNDLAMTDIRRAFHIDQEYVEIVGDSPKLRRDVVRLSGPSRPADIRFRAEFTNWEATVELNFNRGVISPEQIFHLFYTAGFAVGVGEWRPQKNGIYGRFIVDPQVEILTSTRPTPKIKKV